MGTTSPKLSNLELRIMEVFWERGLLSIREAQEALPEAARPAYTTVQTLVGRLEHKRALRRVKKIGNAFMFEPAVTRTDAHRRLIDDFLRLFGGRSQPVMAHLIEAGKLTREDIQDAHRLLQRLSKKR